jgi:ComF family protein
MYKNKVHYLRKMAAWLLPFSCILCKKESFLARDLCHDCEQVLPLLKKHCLQCAYPLDETLPDTVCESCVKIPSPFDAIHILYLYKAPIKQLILELKFKYILLHAQLLGDLLAQKIKEKWYVEKPLPDIIIPIPLHSIRLKERGFNQALEIARPIAKSINRPIAYHLAQRIKATSAQATLNLTQRQQNIQQAFVVQPNVLNQHVAVIDDVMTTGETIREFCKAIRQAGARQVDVWCVARAVQ